MVKSVGIQATPEVIATWGEVYQLFQQCTGDRRERLEQVAEQLGITPKVAKRRLRNYEAMNNIAPTTTPPVRRKAAIKGEPERRIVAPGSSDFEDQILTCVDCGKDFPFTAREQAFFAEKGFQSPKRCKDCKQVRKAQAEAAKR